MTLRPLGPLTVAVLSLAILQARAADEPVATVQAVRTQQGPVSSLLRGYGVVGTTASLTQSISLPYLARVTRLRVSPGQVVHQHDPLLEISADPAAVLASAQARTAVNDARAEQARVKAQFDLRLATASQLAVAQKAVADAQQALDAQQATGARPGTQVITAPRDGTVLQISAAQGDQVAAGTALMLLSQPSGPGAQANFYFGIEPADAAQLHKGDALTVTAVASNLAVSAQGSVTSLGHSIDATSQLVTIGANVALQNASLMPGMHVSVEVRTQPKTLWQVPAAALLGQPDTYLFQVAQGHARRVAVKVLADDGQQLGVDGALDASQPVVTVGSAQLADGMAVQLETGAATSSTSATGAAAQ